MKIIFEPKKKYLTQIENWLKEEYEEDGEGFYKNFLLIDFTNNDFICYVNNDDDAIAFMSYQRYMKICTIDIASVKKSEKRKGVCKTMLEALSNRLVERGTYVMNLFCSPVSSEKIWKKLGFKFYKEKEKHESFRRGKPVNYLYKTIVKSHLPTRKRNLISFVELWKEFDHVGYTDKTIEPSVVWNLKNQLNPIIFPTEPEWKLRLVENGKEIYNGVIKRNISGFFVYGDFLIFDKI